MIMKNNGSTKLHELTGGGYNRIWHWKGRYLVIKGSRASKKSKNTALRTIYLLHRYPLSNFLVIRQVFETLRDSCYQDL